jgi:uncharacterized protein (DUF305 family)
MARGAPRAFVWRGACKIRRMKPALLMTIAAVAGMLPAVPAPAADGGAVQVHLLVKDLEARQGEDFEAMFLAFMIHHCRFGIRMAGLADQRASDAALKQRAVTAIEAQKREIAEMDRWLEEWHPRKPGDDQLPRALEEVERQILDELGKSKGAAFDERFSARLAAHRATAVAMARLAAGRAIHEEVKAFARRMVEVKGQERP